MSYFSRFGPYMDPNVYRSSGHSQYPVTQTLTDPRYAASDLLDRDSYRREPLERHYIDPQSRYDYRTDRPYPSNYSSSSRDIDDLVRKTNHNASLTNSSIGRISECTLIQPKVCMDGRYPIDFASPMTLPAFMALPENRLDRLIDEYEVPVRHTGGLGTRGRYLDSSRESTVLKLSVLLDFLGARQVADVLRPRSGSRGNLSGSRNLLPASRR